jgi:uncharacterized protein (TIGR00369 family)
MDADLQRRLAKSTPYYGHLGIEVIEISEGFARLALDFKDRLTHPFGYLHGGAIASLADSAGFNAVLTILNDDDKALTLEMKINFCTPSKEERIYAEGKVIHRGKRFAISDVEVKDPQGTLVAKAIVTCAIF